MGYFVVKNTIKENKDNRLHLFSLSVKAKLLNLCIIKQLFIEIYSEIGNIYK